jgi:hypothetical protein
MSKKRFGSLRNILKMKRAYIKESSNMEKVYISCSTIDFRAVPRCATECADSQRGIYLAGFNISSDISQRRKEGWR